MFNKCAYDSETGSISSTDSSRLCSELRLQKATIKKKIQEDYQLNGRASVFGESPFSEMTVEPHWEGDDD
jgi:hypothetical protein